MSSNAGGFGGGFANSIGNDGFGNGFNRPRGVIWSADFTNLPLSTSTNASLIRRALGAMGLTFTRSSTATVQTGPGVVVTSGINVDDPRVGNGGYGQGLVVEETRSNVLPISETINTWNVTGTASILGTNTIVAPDGNTTAEEISMPASGDGYWRGGTIGAGTYRTRSIWVQSTTGGAGDLYLTDAGYVLADTTITTGPVWTRGSSTDTSATATGTVWFRKATSTAVRAWGGQVEAGRFATEYIPTSGGTAQRQSETLSLATASSIVRNGRVSMEFRYIPKHSQADQNSTGNMLFAQGGATRVYWGPTAGGLGKIYMTDGVTPFISNEVFPSYNAGDVIDVFFEFGNGAPYACARKNNGSRTLFTFPAGSVVALNAGAVGYLMQQAGTIAPCSAWVQFIRAYQPGRRPKWAM